MIWRCAALLTVAAVFYPCLEVSSFLLDLAGSARGRRRASGRWRTRVFRSWCRLYASILGMRTSVVGLPPQPPFLLVSNHLGYLDILLLASQLPCVFVSKAEVAHWPIIGHFCRAVDTIFLDRANKRELPRVMRQIDRVCSGGRGVVFFPEGTSTSGHEVREFRPSLLEAAARSGRPVSYASLSYRTQDPCPPARDAVCWWGDTEFRTHVIRLMKLPGFEARLKFGKEPIQSADRKVLASRLHEAVQQQFEAVV